MFRINHILILTLTLTVLITGAPRPAIAMEDAIIAIVNDELITLRDLKDYVQSIYMNLAAEGLPKEELEKIMLDLEVNGINKLVEDKLILSRANKLEIEIRDQLVNERVEEIKKQYPSEQEFYDALAKVGSTVTQMREKITEQLKIRYVVDYEVRGKVYVNPNKITSFYKDNIEEFKRSERVNLDSIYIDSQDNPDQAMTQARKVYDEILAGKPFEDAAKEYSSGASIGVVERGQMLPEIEEIVFNLSEGELAEPIVISSGVYIFKLIRHVPPQIAELKEVKDQIQNILFRQEFEAQYNKWIEELKKDAYVEIKQ